MTFINIYIKILKNNKNYDIILYNKINKIFMILNITYSLFFKKFYKLYLKLIKFYLLENGFKILLIENWYKFGVKYNLILKLIKK